MIRYKQCDTIPEIEQILELQKLNLPGVLSETTKLQQGFVTVKHNKKLLEEMNDAWPHTLAKMGTKVVGYALSMDPKFGKEIDVLLPMFQKIELHKPSQKYMVMGQICIAKGYRGQGIFRGLYHAMLGFLGNSFTEIITEVDAKNTRSLGAHMAIGFKEILRYSSEKQDWILLSLKNKTR